MKKKYKPTVPEPSHKTWNTIIPNNKAPFCLNYAKIIIAFTALSLQKIRLFFIQNKNQKSCKRIKKTLLDLTTIQISNPILYTQTHYPKMFLLFLFFTIGTTLFSCSGKSRNRQKFEKIEIVEDTVAEKFILREEIALSTKIDSIENTPAIEIPLVQNQKKHLKHKGINLTTIASNEEKISTKSNRIYLDSIAYGGDISIAMNPDYPGGIESFYDMLKKEYKIPKKIKKLIDGVMNTSFTIEKDGRLDDIKIINDLGFGTGDEAIRVLKKSMKWNPGEILGKKVRTFYNLPITFRLDSLNTKKRKRKFSKITSIKIIKIGESSDETHLNLNL